jgi:hypothetical protein
LINPAFVLLGPSGSRFGLADFCIRFRLPGNCEFTWTAWVGVGMKSRMLTHAKGRSAHYLLEERSLPRFAECQVVISLVIGMWQSHGHLWSSVIKVS